jgi:hypothetical protein
MKRANWAGKLVAILGVALVAAAAAAALPDDPYQRWQSLENTLYANATWSYERIHFDARPIDVAIIGASRSQMGLSAPTVAARLAALGRPATVANLSVVEDGRNLEWAIADELFRVKRPKVVVVMIGETVHRWGHPGFKYVAPAAAVAAPPAPLLHNYLADLAYLPYRQLTLFAARLAPGLSGLRDRFDAAIYAAKPVDYSQSQTLADGKRIDMDGRVSPADLEAERRKFAASRHESHLPAAISRFTDIDNRVYVDAIHRLAASHGARLIFVFLPEFDGATTIQDRAFYAARGEIADDGDLAHDASLFQSFSHLNRRGAVIASDRLAATIAADLAAPSAAPRTTA